MTTPRTPTSETRSSIYLGSDGRYHGRVTVGRKPDGTAIRRHRSGRTRGEVVRKVRELEQARDAGTLRMTSHDPTLAVWLEHWLTAVIAVRRRPKTSGTYASQMRLHVIPELGSVKLNELTTEMAEELYASLVRRGVGEPTVHAVHRVLRSAMSEAVARRRVAFNPISAAAVRKPVEVEIVPLTRDEVRDLLDAVRTERNAARWGVALALGLRQGESLGLRWPDVNLQTGTLRVNKAVQRLTWKHGCKENASGRPGCGRNRGGSCPARHGGGLQLVELKTEASRRDVTLPQALLEELRAHRQRQVEERLQAPEWNDLDMVFATETGGYIDPKHDSMAWHRLLACAGVRQARLHDARHTAATLLLVLGVHPRTVMDIMGWTEMRTLLRYTHVVDELRRAAADKLDTALWPERTDGQQ